MTSSTTDQTAPAEPRFLLNDAGDKICKTCRCTLSRRNTSGFCNYCLRQTEDYKLAASRAQKRRLADPIIMARVRQTMIANQRAPGAREARSAASKRIGLDRIGRQALEGNSEARRKAGRSISRTRLAGVPRDQWDFYRDLVKNKHVRKEEALRLALEQQEADRIRIRRELQGARA